MILLTGPNVRTPISTGSADEMSQMAGKSTMLRMTCAAIIMAQRTCTRS